jgi:hypothetical protein
MDVISTGFGILVAVVVLIALGIVFFAGLAVGRAVESAPVGGGDQTLVRTLVPATLTPRETVTVTVSNP